MDGTLTKPRKEIAWSTITQLKDLQKISNIGIVSGSPYEYIVQQMENAWSEINSLDPQHLIIMPCNGTKLYEYSNEKSNCSKFTKTYETDMIQNVGEDSYRQLVTILNDLQSQVIKTQKKIPLSGNFISFRGSMVNWCMIGRDADDAMRNQFKKIDTDLRIKLKNKLDNEIKLANIDNISTALGGSTSIDIYPKGWDKTYCLNHIANNKKVYFVGDKCQPGGNDYELFISKKTISYETTGPEMTHEIISDIKRDILNG